MTLAQMISDIYRDHGNDFQVEPADILRHISTVQQMAFAHDCPAFMETAPLSWSQEKGPGPYAWPSSARSIHSVESTDGRVLPASFQPIRRTVTLLSDPGQDCVFRYHIKPEVLSSDTDDAKILVPEEWHYPVLVQGAVALCESASYGDKATVPDLSNILKPFWAAMDALDAPEGRRPEAEPSAIARMVEDLCAGTTMEPADALRHLSNAQRIAFAYPVAAFRDSSRIAYDQSKGAGPYAWPTDARAIVSVEDVEGRVLASTTQPVRRTVVLAEDPGRDFIVRYYIQPQNLTSFDDDDKLLIPEEWRYPVLVRCARLLYTHSESGEGMAPDLSAELKPFWESMDTHRVQDGKPFDEDPSSLRCMVSDALLAVGPSSGMEPSNILRLISDVQRMAYEHDCSAFILSSTIDYDSAIGAGPYAWPMDARAIVSVEDLEGNLIFARMQSQGRTVILGDDPGQNFVVRYYIRPEELTSLQDEDKILLPESWRRPLLLQGAILLCDSANGWQRVQALLAQFWDSMDWRVAENGPRDSDAFLSSVGSW